MRRDYVVRCLATLTSLLLSLVLTGCNEGPCDKLEENEQMNCLDCVHQARMLPGAADLIKSCSAGGQTMAGAMKHMGMESPSSLQQKTARASHRDWRSHRRKYDSFVEGSASERTATVEQVRRDEETEEKQNEEIRKSLLEATEILKAQAEKLRSASSQAGEDEIEKALERESKSGRLAENDEEEAEVFDRREHPQEHKRKGHHRHSKKLPLEVLLQEDGLIAAAHDADHQSRRSNAHHRPGAKQQHRSRKDPRRRVQDLKRAVRRKHETVLDEDID
eukprot:TRINITY_DN15190_c0_g1_i1.p1 TRINITY_DN15190_c0_g1~~TRINITY_DN15190_c0_g1_i1.p1  ORF type:complete len:277 (+),score=69.21 TRINITY_DN15190_c0_g1_i1:130-960(+)